MRQVLLLTILGPAISGGIADARRPDGVLQLAVVDAATDEPIPARIELRNARGRAEDADGWGLAPLGDHAYIDSAATLGLRRGAYRFTLDAGPEYRTQEGHFQLDRYADDRERVAMRRFANMEDEGWVAIDLQCDRDPPSLPIVHRTERLAASSPLTHRWIDGGWRSVAETASPIAAWWSGPGGTVWLYAPEEGLTERDLPDLSTDTTQRLRAARRDGWRVVASVGSDSLPDWASADALDAVWLIDGLADDSYDAGYERMRRYYDLLNSGVRLPPLGGSASGVTRDAKPNRRSKRIRRPLGDGRTWLVGEPGEELADYWTAIELGQVVVSNGPLLRPTADGLRPGGVFDVTPGEPREVLIGLNLATRRSVEYLQVIADGETVMSVRLSDWARGGGKLPPLRIDQHRWFAIRAITDNQDRLQVAHSGPWYVNHEE